MAKIPFKKTAAALALTSSLSACGGGFDIPDMRGGFTKAPTLDDIYVDNTPSSAPVYVEKEPVTMTDVNPSYIGIRSLPYYGAEPAGTIMIHEDMFKLYFVEGDGSVTEYPIATARANVHENYSNMQVGLLRENPTWNPTDTMVGATGTTADDPENPLGEYAINLNRNGGDTLIRIHGTRDRDRQTIGTKASSGCFRMLNEHVENLFYKVKAFQNAGVTMNVRHYEGVSLVPGVGYNFYTNQPSASVQPYLVSSQDELPGIFRRIFN